MSDAARRFFDSDDPARWGRDEMPEQQSVTIAWRDRTGASGPTLELGCGRGALSSVFDDHTGIDLAFVPLRQLPRGVNADMERLPIRDRSVGFAFSWAALEHVPHPELVLSEIERVLRTGGVAVLAPAWHCRPWAAEGLEFRGYRELTPSQRIRKWLIPLRNSLVWRSAFEVPRRALRELAALIRLPSFPYERLNPNLTEYVGTDCDAFTSMDPQAMALYFAKRGWDVLSHPTLTRRMLARHEAVVVRKTVRCAAT